MIIEAHGIHKSFGQLEVLKGVSLTVRRGEVVSTQLILQRIWGDDSFFNARSLHVFVTRLRHRLAADPDIRLVNARGVGYKLLF